MNFSYAEFWKLVKTKPEYREISKDIEKKPEWGYGSKGGSRVLICDNCGMIKYIHNPQQNFCSRKCRYDYYHTDATPKVLPVGARPKKKKKLHRYCGYCNKRFELHAYRIRAGNGIFCSLECAKNATGLIPLWYKCNTCGMEFRAVTDNTSRFCSIECAANKRNFNESEEYIESTPILSDPDEFVDHRINMIMKSIQSEHPDVKLNPTLRYSIITKKNHDKVDDYYLTPKQRKMLKDMKLLLIDDEE